MFTQSCYLDIKGDAGTKNRLIKAIENMGYKPDTSYFQSEGDYVFLMCLDGIYYLRTDLFSGQAINCGTNEVLFLALAALNDKYDNEQYFIADRDVLYMEGKKGIAHIADKGQFKKCEEIPLICSSAFHKATPAELIEHFK